MRFNQILKLFSQAAATSSFFLLVLVVRLTVTENGAEFHKIDNDQEVGPLVQVKWKVVQGAHGSGPKLIFWRRDLKFKSKSKFLLPTFEIDSAIQYHGNCVDMANMMKPILYRLRKFKEQLAKLISMDGGLFIMQMGQLNQKVGHYILGKISKFEDGQLEEFFQKAMGEYEQAEKLVLDVRERILGIANLSNNDILSVQNGLNKLKVSQHHTKKVMLGHGIDLNDFKMNSGQSVLKNGNGEKEEEEDSYEDIWTEMGAHFPSFDVAQEIKEMDRWSVPVSSQIEQKMLTALTHLHTHYVEIEEILALSIPDKNGDPNSRTPHSREAAERVQHLLKSVATLVQENKEDLAKYSHICGFHLRLALRSYFQIMRENNLEAQTIEFESTVVKLVQNFFELMKNRPEILTNGMDSENVSRDEL